MAKGNESTTKFKVDISELKAGMQEAKRQIRMATAEFKAATAGMDKWSDSADGISAKIKQLTAILDAEKAKLENLKKQYELVAQAQGENSRGAQELLIQINNQTAAIKRTEANIEKYNQKLEEVKGSTQELESAYEKLRQEIEKLKALDQSVWLEVEYSGGDKFNLKDMLFALTADSKIEIL